MKLIGKLLKFLFLLFLAFALIAFGYYLAITKEVTLSPNKLLLNDKNIIIYAADGTEIRDTSSFNKRNVCIEQIPKSTQDAFVCVEDKRFFQHNGFDLKGIARASLRNIASRSFKEGASTISQQLIKNTHLSQDKTLKRKAQEWKLTRILEKNYSKKEILEKYLNTIYFGHNCFGICAASEFYFGKAVEELSLGESATLAGLLKAPNYYSPFKNPEKCTARRNTVLRLMKECGKISIEEEKNAREETLPLPSSKKGNFLGYLHFVFDELASITEEKGFKLGGNIEITTHLNITTQENIQEICENISDCDKSVFILDNRTHGYTCAYSSVGNIRRLPGSIIKPLLVYAPALELNNLVPATPILDEKVQYGEYSPENYDHQYHGYVSMRECVEKSLNIPAVKVLDSIGLEKATPFCEKMGLKIDKEDQTLALALGGMKEGFTLQELTNAYSVFPNQGVYEKGRFIDSIKINGKLVYKHQKNEQKVFSEESAYLMTDILRSTAKQGTAKKLRSLPFDIAAKTGTVGTSNGNTDAYALSYTPNECVSVWLGDKNYSYIEHTGGGTPSNILYAIYEYLYKGTSINEKENRHFKQPKKVVCVALDKTSYYDTHTLLLADASAPIEYTIRELFKKDCLPKKQSTAFSSPTIRQPKLSVKNNAVLIRFDKSFPAFYQYKIDRYDYATHNTVYFGEFIEEFIDNTIEKNATYIYTVTPVYNNVAGKTIKLPFVSTYSPHDSNYIDQEIIEKKWWEL